MATLSQAKESLDYAISTIGTYSPDITALGNVVTNISMAMAFSGEAKALRLAQEEDDA